MPAFRSGHPRTRLSFAANVVLTAGAHSPLLYDTVDYDDVGQSNGAGGIVIDRSGLYLVHTGVGRATSGGTQQPISTVLRSGTALLECRAVAQNTATGACASGAFELAAGDVITSSCTLDTAASRTLRGGVITFLSVVRVGPVRYTGN